MNVNKMLPFRRHLSICRVKLYFHLTKEPHCGSFLLAVLPGWRHDNRRLVMVTSSSEGTMMPLEMLLAIAWLRFFESVLLVT